MNAQDNPDALTVSDAEPVGPALVRFPDGRLFNTEAPEGMCPWAEQACDARCGDFTGCKQTRR